MSEYISVVLCSPGPLCALLPVS